MDATRELKLKLTVQAPDAAPAQRSFDSIASSARGASLAVQDANKQMQRMQAPGMGPTNSGGFAAAGSGGSSVASSSIAWTRPGFTGAPSNISWTRPGFTGAPSSGPILPVPSPAASPPAVPQILQGSGSAIHGANPNRSTSSVSAFDRPQAVMIVGPRPLPVTMIGGGPGGVGGVAGAAGGIGGPKPAPSAGGLMTGLAGAAGTVAAIATTAAAFGNLTEAVAQASQPTTTAADRFTLLSQALAKSVPIIGDSLAGIVASVQNAAGRLTDWSGSLQRDKYRAEFPLNMAKDAIESRGRDRIDTVNRSTRATDAALAARQAFPTLASQAEKQGQSGGFGGLLMKGAWENKDDRLKGAMEAVQDSRRSLAEADAAAGASKLDLARQRQRSLNASDAADAATRSREEADRRAGVGGGLGGGSKAGGGKSSGFANWAGTLVPGLGLAMAPFGQGPAAEVGRQQVAKDERGQKLLEEQKAITAALREQEKLLAAQERSGQAIAEATKKRLELSKAETALMKTRVDLMQEELSKSRNAQRSFGALSSVEQEGVLADLKTFKENGREALTEGSFSRLQSLAPDFVGQQIEEKTKDNPLTKEFMTQLGLKDTQTLEKEITNAKAELAVKVQIDAEEFQKTMKAEMDKLNGNLTGLIKQIITTEIRLERNRNEIGNAQGRSE